MRNRLGTKSRLAAHITAVALLIIILVFFAVPSVKETPPLVISQASWSRPTAHKPTPTVPEDSAPAPAGDGGASAGEATTTTAAQVPTPAADGAEVGTPPTPTPPVAGDSEDQPAEVQPDESGSLVVAVQDSGDDQAALQALSGHNALEVLGDGVYWLGADHDLQKELGKIPEVNTLVLLAPASGYRMVGPDRLNAEYISASPDELSADAAARFVHLTDGTATPVVVAVIRGARGAAYYKGAYLLANRKMGIDEVLPAIAAELRQAGPEAEEIVHRLRRLRPEDLR